MTVNTENVENYIYTELESYVQKEYPNAVFGQADANSDMEFPYVKVEMDDSYEREDTIDSSGEMKYLYVRFTVDIYSSKSKTETKEIMTEVTKYMRASNLIKKSEAPMQVGAKSEIYRRVATFEGTVGSDGSLSK